MFGGNTVEHNDPVGQVGRHDEVVLDHERRLLGVKDVSVNKYQSDDRDNITDSKLTDTKKVI